jgi:uncharacterized protein YeaO (DUF488 family)
MTRTIRLKRVYEPPAGDDGMRILVDRLWPRGLRRAEAHLDHWLKDAAPSPGLRRWFDHRSDRWQEFRRRYRAELRGSAAVRQLLELSAKGDVTLLYAAKDEAHNHALVLAKYLRAAPA